MIEYLMFATFQDKFKKISDLLSGNQVRTGDIDFSASEHPLGINYCTFLLAKKFIVSFRGTNHLVKTIPIQHTINVQSFDSIRFYSQTDTRNNCYK